MVETVYHIQIPEQYSFSHVCIALIADTHNFPCKEIPESLKKNKPDIIAVCGDFIYGEYPEEGFRKMEESGNAVNLLKTCADIAPTYVSLGNHEFLLTAKDLEIIEDLGVSVLNNSWQRFHDEILVGGLTSAAVTGKHQRKSKPEIPEYGWLETFEQQNGYKILLSHHPEYWALQQPYLKNRPIDLVMSGHAHGGQLRFYWKGEWHGFYDHGQGLFPKYTSGVHAGPYGNMVISRGLSNTSMPLPRLNNETEMVYIILDS